MPTAEREIETLANREYKWGFVTDIEADSAPPGLNEETVRFISKKKNEPQWMLDWRLKAYRHWLTMEEPHGWPMIKYPPIDYQASSYFSAPKPKNLRAWTKSIRSCWRRTRSSAFRCTSGRLLGRRVAVDAVFDSVSVATTFKEEARREGDHLLLASAKRCRIIRSS